MFNVYIKKTNSCSKDKKNILWKHEKVCISSLKYIFLLTDVAEKTNLLEINIG